MERVSVKIAKYIKEIGYPQNHYTTEVWYKDNGQAIIDDIIIDEDISLDTIYAAPYILELWDWLWREKNIHIEIISSSITTKCYATINNEKDTILFNSPEEAIIAAIKYLVNNDLIK